MNAFPVIDAHTHIFPEKIAAKAIKNIGNYYGIAMRGGGTAQDLLRIGANVGIQKFVVHSTATKIDQVRSINDFIADATNACPDFIGLGTLHPGLPDLPAEVEGIFRARGYDLFPGGKLGPGKYDMTSACSCPDYANPCKHVLAALLVLGEEIARRPSTLLALRGIWPEDLVDED